MKAATQVSTSCARFQHCSLTRTFHLCRKFSCGSLIVAVGACPEPRAPHPSATLLSTASELVAAMHCLAQAAVESLPRCVLQLARARIGRGGGGCAVRADTRRCLRSCRTWLAAKIVKGWHRCARHNNTMKLYPDRSNYASAIAWTHCDTK